MGEGLLHIFLPASALKAHAVGPQGYKPYFQDGVFNGSAVLDLSSFQRGGVPSSMKATPSNLTEEEKWEWWARLSSKSMAG
jgi:hypothetical protein